MKPWISHFCRWIELRAMSARFVPDHQTPTRGEVMSHNKRSLKLIGLLFLAATMLCLAPSNTNAEDRTDQDLIAAEQEVSPAEERSGPAGPQPRPKSSRYDWRCFEYMRIEYGKPEKDSDSAGEWEFTMGSMF